MNFEMIEIQKHVNKPIKVVYIKCQKSISLTIGSKSQERTRYPSNEGVEFVVQKHSD